MGLAKWLGMLTLMLVTQGVAADAHMCPNHGGESYGSPMGHGRLASFVGSSAPTQPGAEAVPIGGGAQPSAGGVERLTGLQSSVNASYTPEASLSGVAGDGAGAPVLPRSMLPGSKVTSPVTSPEGGAETIENDGSPGSGDALLWCVASDDPRCAPMDGSEGPEHNLRRWAAASQGDLAPCEVRWVRVPRRIGRPDPAQGSARAGYVSPHLRPPNLR